MVRVGPLALIPETLCLLGQEPGAVFRSSGLGMEEFLDTEHRVPFLQAARLLHNCVTATGCEQIGLLVGQRASLSHLGLAGFMAKSAPSVETALRSLVENFDLHDSGGSLSMDVGSACTTLGYFVHLDDVEAIEQINDLCATVMVKLMRALCGSDWHARQVKIPRHRPPDIAPYQQFFLARICYDARELAVTFDSHWLRAKPPTADELLYRYLQRQAESAHAMRDARIAESIASVLRRGLLTERFSAADIAEHFGLHERTLHRRLRSAGTTFRSELDAARQSVSRELLDNTALPISEIANAVGYADSSSFIRAFQRWTGMSPSLWRERTAGIIYHPAKPGRMSPGPARRRA